MILPLLLLIFAILSAAIAAYGTASSWVSVVENGMSVICFSRRAGWPLWALCVVCCLGLLALVVTGKRRVWWLLGLAPVLVLFVHRFATDPMRQFGVADDLPMSRAADVRPEVVADADNVVGLVVGGVPMAYPTATLWRWPVLSQNVFEHKLVLIWNPYANLGRAWSTDRDLSAREMEVVAMPANATLLYNRRYGQFINGVTGLQTNGSPPTGFARQIPVSLTTWGRWKALYPETKICLENADGEINRPVVPEQGLLKRRPTTQSTLPTTPIKGPGIVVDAKLPLLLATSDVSEMPMNLPEASGDTLVVFRDPTSGFVRAFRSEPGQRFARQTGVDDKGNPAKGFMVEVSAGTVWSARGKSLESTGPALGKELPTVIVHEGPWLQVVHDWYPESTLHVVGPGDFAVIAQKEPPPPASRPARPSRRRGTR